MVSTAAITESTVKDILETPITEDVTTVVYKVNALVKKDEQPGFTNILKEYNGRAYVHAGIAFFGGGKNYGVLDTDRYTFHSFNKYEIGLMDVGAGYMQAAAGDETFYFVLHDATSTFTPQEQEKMLTTDAYGFISKKD